MSARAKTVQVMQKYNVRHIPKVLDYLDISLCISKSCF